MAKRYSHDEYKAKLLEINPNLDMISTYKNSKTKIRVKNKVCNHEWDVVPTSLLLGHGCPICSGRQKKNHYNLLRIPYWEYENIEETIKNSLFKGGTDYVCKI